MPTGYTCIIEDGATFEEFVWRCARGMGALIMMRDESLDAPIDANKVAGEGNYEDTQLAEARERLIRLQSTTLEEAGATAKAEHERALREWEASVVSHNATRGKYQAMRAKVADWHPPTVEHVGLKTFMLEQIDLSFRLDEEYPYDKPKLEDARAWLKRQLENARHNVEYYTEQRAKRIERENGRRDWILNLQASVPMPPRKLRK